MHLSSARRSIACARTFALWFVLSVVSGGAASATDDGSIILPRHPAPSPDGGQIAFSYQGDIWVVPREGGEARRLTAHPAYEGGPIWSPDGRWIAFYSERDGNEDVFVIPVHGGMVRRLTWYSGMDVPTGWTPDSKAVIFEGYRHIRERGLRGTFLVPLEGGEPAALLPTGARNAVLSPDGSRLAYLRGSIAWWRRGYEGNARFRIWLHELAEPLPPSAGLERREVRSIAPARSPHRPDARWDEPTCTAAASHANAALLSGGRHLNLTEAGSTTSLPNPDPGRGYLATYLAERPDWSHPEIEVGSNTYPQWLPDADHLLYLSEYRGYANLKIMSIAGQSRSWVTRFKDGRLRFPSLSANGRVVAFEYEDGIYTVVLPADLPGPGETEWPTPVPEPVRLDIRIPLDEPRAGVERMRVSGNAQDFALSPDGKQIAFVHEGEIFAMKSNEDEKQAYRLTESAARDENIRWSPDSKSLLFVSDRNGGRDVYLVRSADEDEPRLARSLHLETQRLTDDDRDDWGPVLSPDGERIAYLQGTGALIVMDADGSGKRRLIDGWADLEFRWSPDSRWIAYSQEDDDFNTEIWVVSADGKDGPHNISQHPDDDYAPRWSPDGRMLAFSSNRQYLNQTDIWYVWLRLADEQLSHEDRQERLSGDSADQSGEEDEGDDGDKDDADGDEEEEEELVVEIDFEDIHKRLHRLTTFPGSESGVLIAKDGSGFAFVSDTDGERDLWYIKWTGDDPKRITHGGQDPRQLQLSKDGKNIYFLGQGGAIKSVPFEGGESKSYSFSGEMTIDRARQRAFVFDEAWRRLGAEFYDGKHHGADWPALREKYRPWALGASTYQDFQDVIKMLLGELNSSHLGTWGGPGDWSSGQPGAETGVLGTLYDAHYQGPGLKIIHILKNSPADRVESKLAVGEIILRIGEEEVDTRMNLSRLMDRTVGKKIILDVEDAGGDRREVVIRPMSATERSDMLYRERVEMRQRFVGVNSDNRVAYVHISGMNTSSLDRFERDLYAQAHGKDALIIDVRGNGGGWTTDLMLTSLLAGDHAVTVPRGGGPGYPQGRRLLYAWTKPVVVLCDEHSFSNAEIFSWSIRTLGRGTVVGQQTHGGVISTGGTHLGDGSWLRLPFRGWTSRLDGSNLEGTGCLPDIVIENHPDDIARGIDLQLDRALQEALRLSE